MDIHSITPSYLVICMYQKSYAESDELRSSLRVVFSFTRDVEWSLLQVSLDTSLRRFSFIKKIIQFWFRKSLDEKSFEIIFQKFLEDECRSRCLTGSIPFSYIWVTVLPVELCRSYCGFSYYKTLCSSSFLPQDTDSPEIFESSNFLWRNSFFKRA